MRERKERNRRIVPRTTTFTFQTDKSGQKGKKRRTVLLYVETRVYVCACLPACLCVCVICLPIRDLCARRSKLRKKKKKRKGKLSLSWYLRARSLARLMCLVYPILFFSSPVVHMLHTQFTLSRTDYKNGPLK